MKDGAELAGQQCWSTCATCSKLVAGGLLAPGHLEVEAAAGVPVKPGRIAFQEALSCFIQCVFQVGLGVAGTRDFELKHIPLHFRF